MALRFSLVVVQVFALALAGPVQGQEPGADLQSLVARLDEVVFSAFNDRDPDRFLPFFADDLEFYHDKDGLSGHAEMVESSLRLFGQESPLHRELVPGSLEVHAVPGYGAIQIGRHEFCHWENGAEDCGVFGFTHLWRQMGDRWQITRVFSYGH
jgi:hypothetical protein